MAKMDPSAADMALAVWNGYDLCAGRQEDMHVSDAPSGQELDGAGCGSRSSCQKQVVFM